MYDEYTKIRELLKDPKACEIIDRHLRNITKNPSINMVKGFSLKALAAFPQVRFGETEVDACLEELKKLGNT